MTQGANRVVYQQTAVLTLDERAFDASIRRAEQNWNSLVQRMRRDQEIQIRARLVDQASQQLTRIQQQARQLGSQPANLTVNAHDNATSRLTSIMDVHRRTNATTTATVTANDRATPVITGLMASLRRLASVVTVPIHATTQAAGAVGGSAQNEATSAASAAVGAGIGGGGMALGAGLVATAAAFGVATKMAGDFQDQMVTVRNNTTMSDDEFKVMTNTVKDLSRQGGESLDNLGLGFMHVVNLTGDAAHATDILNVAMESAVSSGAKTADVANVLANVLHEYGADSRDAAGTFGGFATQAESAAHYMGIMHLAAAEANMTLEQFNQSGGQVFAWAANLHVPVEQASAAFATMTKHGFDAAAAGTQVKDLFEHLIKPSQEATQELMQLSNATGVDLVKAFDPAALSTKGFTGVLDDVREAMAKAGLSQAEMTKKAMDLIPNIRGGAALFTLLGTGASDYDSILHDLNDTQRVNDITEQAYNRTQNTMEFQMRRMGAAATLAGTALGEHLLPVVTPLVQALADNLPGALDATGKAIQDTVGWFQRLTSGGINTDIALTQFGNATTNLTLRVSNWLQTAWQRIDWGRVWDVGTSMVQGLATNLANLAGRTVSTVTTWAQQQWARLDWTAIWNTTTGTVAALQGWLGNQWGRISWISVWQNVKDIAVGLPDTVGSINAWLGQQWARIDWGTVWSNVTGVFSAAMDIASEVTSWLTNQWSNVKWGDVWADVSSLGSSIWGNLRNIWDDLTLWLSIQWARVDWGKVWQSAGGLFTGLSDSFSGAFASLDLSRIPGLTGTFDNLRETFDSLKMALIDIGKSFNDLWILLDGPKWAGLLNINSAMDVLGVLIAPVTLGFQALTTAGRLAVLVFQGVASGIHAVLDAMVAIKDINDKVRAGDLGGAAQVVAGLGERLSPIAPRSQTDLAEESRQEAELRAQVKAAADARAATGDDRNGGRSYMPSGWVDPRYAQQMRDQAANVGKAVPEGFATGVDQNSQTATQATTKLTDDATAAALAGLDIQSPSKVFSDIGRNVVEGFSKGLTGNNTILNDAITQFGQTLATQFKSMIGNVSTNMGQQFSSNIGQQARQGAAALTGGIWDQARAAAQAAGVDPDVFVRQINEESGGNPNAQSGAGAQGIAQFMPGTARSVAQSMNVSYEQFMADPNLQLQGAAKLDADNLRMFNGNYGEALAAYNAGAGAVQKAGGIPQYAETQKYVKDILGYANGGIISEPIVGVGASGQMYAFGEGGRQETVAPSMPAPGGGGRGGRGAVTLHVYPSAGMDEQAFAEKVTALIQQHAPWLFDQFADHFERALDNTAEEAFG